MQKRATLAAQQWASFRRAASDVAKLALLLATATVLYWIVAGVVVTLLQILSFVLQRLR